ncbi:hypothetical protein FRC06_011504 [Ceratobasidium sp. 370]|nr:hypothetical protein FRC06_011504 [Ceratobasidium sp. 370]
MTPTDVDPRLTEFVAFLKRPPSEQNFFELPNILARIFQVRSNSRKRHVRATVLRSSLLSNRILCENLQWLPEYSPNMAPHTTRGRPDAESHSDRDVSGRDGSNSSPAHSVPGTTGGRVRASDEHHQHQPPEPQSDDYDKLSNDTSIPSTHYPPERYPGSAASHHEHTSTLVPFRDRESSHPMLPLPSLQLGDNTATRSSSGPPRRRVPPIEPNIAVYPPSVYQSSATPKFAQPMGPAPPPAPPSSVDTSSARSSGAHYTRTELRHDRTTTLTSSGGSVTSSTSVPTPNSSSAGQGRPWAYIRSGSIASGWSMSSTADRAKVNMLASAGDGVRFAPPLTSADYVESMPPPPPRGTTASSETATMYTEEHFTHDHGNNRNHDHSPDPLNNHDYEPEVDDDLGGGEGEDQNPTESEGEGGGVAGGGRATWVGGPPVVTPQQRDAIAANPPRNFTMVELGDVIDWFYNPTTGHSSLIKDMQLPGAAALGIFRELLRIKFRGQRSATALRSQFKNLNAILRELMIFRSHFSLDFVQYDDEEALLQLLHSQLKQLAAQGIKLKNLTAWKVLVFVRQHWYHWMRVAIGNHPNVVGSTDNHSGVVLPLQSPAPSRTAIQPSALSRPSNQSSTLSRPATQSRATARPSASSHSHTQPPAQPRVSPPPSVGSSCGGKGKTSAKRSDGPPANPTTPASTSQALPPSTISNPRSASASSSSQLCVSRKSASARQVRRVLPTGGLAGARPSRYSCAAPHGSGTTDFPSEASSSTRSRTTESLFDPEIPGGAEMVRQHCSYLDEELEISRADAENDCLFREVQLHISGQVARINARAARQRMQLERDTAALSRVTARIQHAAAQTSMITNATAAIGPQHPNYPQMSGQAAAQSTNLGNFNDMLAEARQQIEEEMGPLDEDEDEDMTLPLSLPPTQFSTPGFPPSLSYPSYPRTTFPLPQAGPSNYQSQLHNTTSTSGRFEDMGTVVGSPREEAGGGEHVMEGVESLSIGGNDVVDDDEDLEYVDPPPRPPRRM